MTKKPSLSLLHSVTLYASSQRLAQRDTTHCTTLLHAGRPLWVDIYADEAAIAAPTVTYS
jgi:hypothetical protein